MAYLPSWLSSSIHSLFICRTLGVLVRFGWMDEYIVQSVLVFSRDVSSACVCATLLPKLSKQSCSRQIEAGALWHMSMLVSVGRVQDVTCLDLAAMLQHEHVCVSHVRSLRTCFDFVQCACWKLTQLFHSNHTVSPHYLQFHFMALLQSTPATSLYHCFSHFSYIFSFPRPTVLHRSNARVRAACFGVFAHGHRCPLRQPVLSACVWFIYSAIFCQYSATKHSIVSFVSAWILLDVKDAGQLCILAGLNVTFHVVWFREGRQDVEISLCLFHCDISLHRKTARHS